MTDIVSRLRLLPEPQCRPCLAAADEIERLRLTDEEREAIERLEDHCAKTHCVDTARVLRGLLERHGY